jgi:hypothetical protein
MLSVIAPTNFVFKNYSSRFNINKRNVNNPRILKTTSSAVVQKKKMIPNKDPVGTVEKLNGRLAMLGFLAGSGYEYVSGVNYIDQLPTTWPFVVLMSTVISFATLKTRNLEVIEKVPFTTNLELLNGRMAMLGIMCKFIYDSHVFF